MCVLNHTSQQYQASYSRLHQTRTRTCRYYVADVQSLMPRWHRQASRLIQTSQRQRLHHTWRVNVHPYPIIYYPRFRTQIIAVSDSMLQTRQWPMVNTMGINWVGWGGVFVCFHTVCSGAVGCACGTTYVYIGMIYICFVSRWLIVIRRALKC